MAHGRTWRLSLNLDAFNSIWATLDTQAEHSDFMCGMWRGMNSGRLPEQATDAFIDGFEMGSVMRGEAEAFRQQAREDGLKGGYRKHSRVTSRPPTTNPEGGLVVSQKPNHKPLTTNQEPTTKSLSSPSAHRPLDEYASIWNGKLVELGYGKMERATPKREKTLQERKRADPTFLETFTKAVAYLAEDSWWRTRAKQFTIDLLFQPDRAQTLSEKAPTKAGESNGTSKSPAHRASVDEAYKRQLAEREQRIQPKPELTPEEIDDMFSMQ